MKYIITLILIVLAVVFTGCGNQQGVLLTDFDKVEINNGFHVDISVGDEYSVVLNVTDEVLEKVEAVKAGDKLIIRAKSGRDLRDASLKAEITLPSLTALSLNNGSWVTVSGSGNDVTLSFKGGSHADLANFEIKNADLTVGDGSHVTPINVNGKLNVEISSGSHVTYIGDPQIGDIDLSGGSTFEKQ